MQAIQIYKFTDDAHEAYFNNIMHSLLSDAELLGQQHASINKPVTEVEYRAYFLNSVEATIQSHIEHNQQIYLPVSGIVIVHQLTHAATHKMETLNRLIHEDEHNLLRLKHQKEKLPVVNRAKQKLRIYVYAGLFILALAEGWFIFEALRITLPVFTAFFSALAIAVAMGFGAHFGGGYITKVTSSFKKLMRSLLILLPAAIIFYAAGNLRANAYNGKIDLSFGSNDITTHTTQVLGWNIAMISLLLFGAAIFFSTWAFITDKESEIEQKHNEIDNKITTLNGSIQQRKQQIAAIERETEQQKANAITKYEYAFSFEQRLIALAKQALQAYKTKNLRHRTDNLCPEFFAYDPELHFTFFFDKAKTFSHV